MELNDRRRRDEAFKAVADMLSDPTPGAPRSRIERCSEEDIARALERLLGLQLLAVELDREGGSPTLRWAPSPFSATAGRLVPLLDRVVRNLQPVSCSPRDPLHCCAALVPPARGAPGGGSDGAPRPVSGRGATLTAAVLGCLAEGAERYSAQEHGGEEYRWARRAELGASALAPDAILLVSDRQYRTRGAWNAKHGRLNRIPDPVPRDAEIAWLAADASLSTRPAWLPACCCLLGYPSPAPDRAWLADSNGCAAGASLEDAAVRGFLELVERDAVAIWWYNRLPRPELRADHLESTLPASVADWLAERGRRFWMLDLANDLGVPVVAAVGSDAEGRRISLGFGAGWSIEDAAERAAGELVQVEISIQRIERRTKEDGAPGVEPDALELLSWHRRASVGSEFHLRPSPCAPKPPTGRWAGTLDDCHAVCRRHDLELFVIDLTRAGVGVPVARTVVPGLRHFWARFAPGRLYDVPVALGWAPARSQEADLNPTPIMF